MTSSRDHLGHDEPVMQPGSEVGLPRDGGQGQMLERDWPPSTLMQVPVIQRARSEQRKTTTSATSSTVPKRPKGMSAFTKRSMPSGSAFRRWSQPPPANQMEPGATLFTRMLNWA